MVMTTLTTVPTLFFKIFICPSQCIHTIYEKYQLKSINYS